MTPTWRDDAGLFLFVVLKVVYDLFLNAWLDSFKGDNKSWTPKYTTIKEK